MSARKASSAAGMPDDLPQAPAHAVALDCAPHLSRDGETHPDWSAVAAIERLQHKGRSRDSATPGNHEEIGTLPQSFHRSDTSDPSGAQAFATLPSARRNDLATSFGCHPGTKAVAALAHDFAGLIGPFHRCFSAALKMMSWETRRSIISASERAGCKNLAGL
jgi:hypothetical protein